MKLANHCIYWYLSLYQYLNAISVSTKNLVDSIPIMVNDIIVNGSHPLILLLIAWSTVTFAGMVADYFGRQHR